MFAATSFVGIFILTLVYTPDYWSCQKVRSGMDRSSPLEKKILLCRNGISSMLDVILLLYMTYRWWQCTGEVDCKRDNFHWLVHCVWAQKKVQLRKMERVVVLSCVLFMAWKSCIPCWVVLPYSCGARIRFVMKCNETVCRNVQPYRLCRHTLLHRQSSCCIESVWQTRCLACHVTELAGRLWLCWSITFVLVKLRHLLVVKQSCCEPFSIVIVIGIAIACACSYVWVWSFLSRLNIEFNDISKCICG